MSKTKNYRHKNFKKNHPHIYALEKSLINQFRFNRWKSEKNMSNQPDLPVTLVNESINATLNTLISASEAAVYASQASLSVKRVDSMDRGTHLVEDSVAAFSSQHPNNLDLAYDLSAAISAAATEDSLLAEARSAASVAYAAADTASSQASIASSANLAISEAVLATNSYLASSAANTARLAANLAEQEVSMAQSAASKAAINESRAASLVSFANSAFHESRSIANKISSEASAELVYNSLVDSAQSQAQQLTADAKNLSRFANHLSNSTSSAAAVGNHSAVATATSLIRSASSRVASLHAKAELLHNFAKQQTAGA